jgi:hypothetical protein
MELAHDVKHDAKSDVEHDTKPDVTNIEKPVVVRNLLKEFLAVK